MAEWQRKCREMQCALVLTCRYLAPNSLRPRQPCGRPGVVQANRRSIVHGCGEAAASEGSGRRADVGLLGAPGGELPAGGGGAGPVASAGQAHSRTASRSMSCSASGPPAGSVPCVPWSVRAMSGGLRGSPGCGPCGLAPPTAAPPSRADVRCSQLGSPVCDATHCYIILF